MSAPYMDTCHAGFEAERSEVSTTAYHYQVDVTRRADFNSTRHAVESMSFRMAANGQIRLIGIPRNFFTGQSPYNFQGDLVIRPREQAGILPQRASFEPPTPHALNFFTDASFPGKDSWEGAPRISSPKNPASMAIAWKSWPGIANTKYNKRSFQLVGCTDFRVAELHALVLALETATVVCRLQPKMQRVSIFSDCQDAIRKLMKADSESNRNDPLVRRAVDASHNLDKKGIRVLVHWVPGHANIEGNEVVDDLAWRTRICKNPKAMPAEIPVLMKEYEIPEHLLAIEETNHIDFHKSRKARLSPYHQTLPAPSYQSLPWNNQTPMGAFQYPAPVVF
ncbi:hypothetical protein CkaCkLH20_09881 [Colletotrichum karsti]|uniref:RNase H type-1 domain-containing protein n=1 Tax=Colletotrichum karsti TaxID=1095194 RepID=A0A9P6LHL5_9PEZI|nr:uncharacterized protein CkaCkLH20_09881 [Colletotrichum karsti]KAF9872702.1 hypothetical protein CkaCkLH20_09881 [Colletotrichum karsti]